MNTRLAIQKLEDEWWNKSVSKEVKDGIKDQGLNPDDMRFYGEICFVECGAKPMALLSGIPSTCALSYLKSVLEPMGVIVHAPGSIPASDNSKKLHAGLLLTPLHTPNFDLSGSIYVCNPTHPLFPKIASEVLTKQGQVTEKVIAEVLDYPFALPERELNDSDDMVEVCFDDIINMWRMEPIHYWHPMELPYNNLKSPGMLSKHITHVMLR